MEPLAPVTATTIFLILVLNDKMVSHKGRQFYLCKRFRSLFAAHSQIHRFNIEIDQLISRNLSFL